MRGHRWIGPAAALCLLAAAAPRAAEAQSRFGVRAGVNFAKLAGDDVDSDLVENRVGLLAGAFVEAPIAEIVNLHLGANYSQKGMKTEAFGGDAELEFDYIEVPALLAVVVPGGNNLDLRLYVGPTLAYMVKCEGTSLGISAGCEDDDDIRKFDLGGAVGAGVSFAMSSGASLLVDGFYNFGFKSIDASPDEDDVKNEVFGVSAGLMFRPD